MFSTASSTWMMSFRRACACLKSATGRLSAVSRMMDCCIQNDEFCIQNDEYLQRIVWRSFTRTVSIWSSASRNRSRRTTLSLKCNAILRRWGSVVRCFLLIFVCFSSVSLKLRLFFACFRLFCDWSGSILPHSFGGCDCSVRLGEAIRRSKRQSPEGSSVWLGATFHCFSLIFHRFSLFFTVFYCIVHSFSLFFTVFHCFSLFFIDTGPGCRCRRRVCDAVTVRCDFRILISYSRIMVSLFRNPDFLFKNVEFITKYRRD